MFFKKEDLTIKILDVIELDQKNINMRNYNRNFNALSFRISADTLLDTGFLAQEQHEKLNVFLGKNKTSIFVAKK